MKRQSHQRRLSERKWPGLSPTKVHPTFGQSSDNMDQSCQYSSFTAPKHPKMNHAGPCMCATGMHGLRTQHTTVSFTHFPPVPSISLFTHIRIICYDFGLLVLLQDLATCGTSECAHTTYFYSGIESASEAHLVGYF